MPGRLVLYIGCGNASGDILHCVADAATGAVDAVRTTPSGSSTSFMAIHPGGRFAYTTQNRADRLSAFALDGRDGALTPLNQVAVAGREGADAAGPAYLEVDGGGRFLLAANYRGHNVVVHRLEPDGRIGDLVQSVSDGLHAHLVRVDPSNRFAFVPYLGSDLVAQYRFDERSGRLAPNDPAAVVTAPGAGPRHLAFHPDGRFVYLANELDGSVYAYAFDGERGTLRELQRYDALPAGYAGRRWASDIHVAPSGRFLYVAQRAHESLAIFAIDPDSGGLTLAGHENVRGKTPRQFTLTSDGKQLLVANQDSDGVVGFAVDAATGRLRHQLAMAAPHPYYVRVLDLPAR
jgi:6-phosphogluconolactonase